MKEDNLTVFRRICEKNLDFDHIYNKVRKPKKAFVEYLRRAIMLIRMYGKYRLAKMEMEHFDNVLSAFDPNSMDFLILGDMQASVKSYDAKDIDYLRSYNVYSHVELNLKHNFSLDVIKKYTVSELIGIYNNCIRGCGIEDYEIQQSFEIVEDVIEEYGWFDFDEYANVDFKMM